MDRRRARSPDDSPRPFASAETGREVLFKDAKLITSLTLRSTRSLCESVTYDAHHEGGLLGVESRKAIAEVKRGRQRSCHSIFGLRASGLGASGTAASGIG